MHVIWSQLGNVGLCLEYTAACCCTTVSTLVHKYMSVAATPLWGCHYRDYCSICISRGTFWLVKDCFGWQSRWWSLEMSKKISQKTKNTSFNYPSFLISFLLVAHPLESNWTYTATSLLCGDQVEEEMEEWWKRSINSATWRGLHNTVLFEN